MDNNAKIGKRCRALRKKKKLTLEGLYDKLQITIAIMNDKKPFIPKNKEEEAILPANRRQVISKIESGKGLSLNNALAYSKYFNVSLNYLYFGEKNYKPEYEQLKNMLGLSDDALNKLEFLKNNNTNIINVLNKLLSPELATDFIDLLSKYHEYTTLKNQKVLVDRRGSRSTFDSFNIKGYINNPSISTSEDLEFISLFKISEQSKVVAKKLR